MLPDLIVAFALALLSGFAGAYEAALLSLSRSRLESLLDGSAPEATGKGRQVFLRSIVAGEQSVRLSVALLHAITLGGFLFFSWISLVHPAINRSTATSGSPASWEVIGLSGVLLLLAGKLRTIAVYFGGVNEERLALNGARCAWLMTLPLHPLAWVFLKTSHILARGLGHRTTLSAEERLEEREEEVIDALGDGELDGVVAEEQREMIEGIFDLKDSDVADVFTPRTEMISIAADISITQAIEMSLEKGFSRLPVHEETRDNIIGIFYARDALQYWTVPPQEVPNLRSIIRSPLFVPETKTVSELLREMRETQTHMAIVLDEYGGTAGLVTIEDVIEEIVGDIHDEYDAPEPTAEPIQELDNDTLVVEGGVHVSDVNEALDIDIIPENDDFETMGGFVLDALGHIPKPGETFSRDGLSIEVLAADPRRVEQVRVHIDRHHAETL